MDLSACNQEQKSRRIGVPVIFNDVKLPVSGGFCIFIKLLDFSHKNICRSNRKNQTLEEYILSLFRGGFPVFFTKPLFQALNYQGERSNAGKVVSFFRFFLNCSKFGDYY